MNDIENLIKDHGKHFGNNSQKIKDLIEYEENVDYMIYDGYSLLITAVIYNKVDLVEMLLEMGANTEIQNPRGETPLYLACSININIVELLLRYGAEINKIIRFGGDTVLSKAISNENIKMIKLLLDNDANPNLGDDKNNTPLQVAASNRNDINTELRKYLLDNDKNNTSLQLSESNHNDINTEIIKLLLQYGADINSKNLVGVTPLFFACLQENILNIDTLLEYGADPYIMNNENQYIMNNPMIKENIKLYVGNKMYELHKLNVAYDMIEIANGIQEELFQELNNDIMEEIHNKLIMQPYDPEKTRLRMEEDLEDIRISRFIEDIEQYGMGKRSSKKKHNKKHKRKTKSKTRK